MPKPVQFRAVHTIKPWRKSTFKDIEYAINDQSRGAKALFSGLNDAIKGKGYGDALYALAWDETVEDGAGVLVRPNGNGGMDRTEMPRADVLKYADNGAPADVLAGYFEATARTALTEFDTVGITETEPRSDAIRDTDRSFWWVNQNQAFKAQIQGGYLWSPKKNANGARNQGYINMMQVRPGDVVFSYADTRIKAVGVVMDHHVEKPKPIEFGSAGKNWDVTGWLVKVEWTLLSFQFSPKTHIGRIAPLLPVKYSPLSQDGDGYQNGYLTALSCDLGNLMFTLVGEYDNAAINAVERCRIQVEGDEEQSAIESSGISETEKEQLVRSRVGQGLFRARVLEKESRCRFTGVVDQSLLIASHIKPWKDSDNNDRLNGDNGLMLAPHVDKLFDRGWISFADNGDVLIAEKATAVISKWGLSAVTNVGAFTKKQQIFLRYHRAHVFKG